FRWYAVGGGPLRESLEGKIDQLGLHGVFVLLGEQSNPYPFYAQADLYVQPSRYEGFGITLTEAKAFGLPVVATDCPTFMEQIVDGRNGLLAPQNARALAYAIASLMDDGALRLSMSRELALEDYDRLSEIEKLYELIEAATLAMESQRVSL
ncbi:MAG: glycosyltransferase family 4 protein, partial [Anaerolineales bacterium]|nr:glycosyltransferase family 4 protein [Anaerolineales bacterium]